MTTVRMVQDGDAVLALVGRDLGEGTAGDGDTAAAALRDLADRIERLNWPLDLSGDLTDKALVRAVKALTREPPQAPPTRD